MKTYLITLSTLLAVGSTYTLNNLLTVEPTQVNVQLKNETLNLDGANLLKQHCFACHNPNSESHDKIIAPPMAAVKRRYSKAYTNEADFVNAIATYVGNPNKDKALMKGAVERFGAMPKMDFKKEEVEAIAKYLFNNNVEEPAWFQEHLKEKHK